MFAIRSNISIDGNTSFVDNWAASNGGENVWEHGVHEGCCLKQDQTALVYLTAARLQGNRPVRHARHTAH